MKRLQHAAYTRRMAAQRLRILAQSKTQTPPAATVKTETRAFFHPPVAQLKLAYMIENGKAKVGH